MTDGPAPRRKPPRPALASRILAVGAAAATTIGLVGAMAARSAPSAPAGPAVATEPPPRPPIHIVVVVRRTHAPAAVAPARVVSRTNRTIVRRYVRSAPVTTTHGS